jgi:hypothetical protein
MKRTSILSLFAAGALAAAPGASARSSASLQALQSLAAAGGTPEALSAGFDGSTASPGSGDAPQLPSSAPTPQAQQQQAMLSNLDFIQSAFSAQYGPGQWKQSHEGWDLNSQIAAAKANVQANPNMTVAQYHDVLRRFFNSMKDFHVSVQFDSTEKSSLPFTVGGTNGRYFITSIDRTKLSASSFPFNVGDELVSFGGQPIAQAVAGLKARLGGNTSLTENALAEMYLTSRSGAGFGDVTKGPINVAVKPEGSSQVVTRQLTWDYSPELISNPGGQKFGVASAGPLSKNSNWVPSMLSPMATETSGPESAANPFGLGNQTSFVPALGEKVWESDPSAIFNAYIFKTPNGHTSGYVRIPSYEPDDADAAVAEFTTLIKSFQAQTDGMVIDEVDNPGGSVPYLYAIASLLAGNAPLTTPEHHVAITQDDVSQATQLLQLAPLVKNDAGAQQVLGPALDGYPVDYTVWRNMVDYSQFVVDQWNAGKTLTDPVAIEGVASINPSSVVSYTKPILLLINELDFSGGDFFPAIMQDNKRATLFGTRTAGAGGFVKTVTYPNQVGVKQFTMTGSIAVRANNQPIENLGVTADVQYVPTAQDYQDGFKEYGAAAAAALDKIIGGPAAPASSVTAR